MKREYLKMEMKKFDIKTEEKVLAACGGMYRHWSNDGFGCETQLSGAPTVQCEVPYGADNVRSN